MIPRLVHKIEGGYPERDGGAEEGQGWGDSRRLMIWRGSVLFVVYLFLQNYFLSRVGISFGLSHLLEKSVVTKLASTMMVVLALRCLLCFLFSFLSVSQKVFGAS